MRHEKILKPCILDARLGFRCKRFLLGWRCKVFKAELIFSRHKTGISGDYCSSSDPIQMSATFKLNSGISTNLSPFITTLQKREHVRPQCFCHFLNYDPGTLCNVSRGLRLDLKRF